MKLRYFAWVRERVGRNEEERDIPPDVGSVFEIVIDGLTLEAVRDGMARGLEAAAGAGARQVTAGNYGGNLGPHHIGLRGLVPGLRDD